MSRELYLTDVHECLERNPLEAFQRQQVRTLEGWEEVAGYWPMGSGTLDSDASMTLQLFSEVLDRNKWDRGRVAIDSIAREQKRELPDGEIAVRHVRGVGLWLRSVVEVTDAS